jgi:hypothetical protein
MLELRLPRATCPAAQYWAVQGKSSAQEGLVKVQVHGLDGEIETLWARPLGDHLFELHNTPLYAYGLSWHDVVEARADTPDRFPVFVRVVEKSGFRTVRVILKPPANVSDASQAVLEGLRKLGCAYEGANHRFIAVDIPPMVDLMSVRAFLIASGQTWEHADPTYEDLFPVPQTRDSAS